jgi:UDP-N-acetylglucosamine--N-acetylmuramyl-(pentapeptide) pyrophosphoryl-undecaprenol N-acetylglucosamine transferase
MKILISGGHLTPALAFCEYALQYKEVQVVFVGRQFSQSSQKQESVEKTEVEKRGIKFVPFESGKLNKPHAADLFHQFIHGIKGCIAARKIFNEEKPDVFLSFGGYLAVPLTIVAWTKRIPVLTHEQTRAPGVANRLIAHFARKIAISYPETAASFPKNKTVLTGNPVRADLITDHSKKPSWLPEYIPQAILYVTGGSQGSQLINQLISQLLPQLTEEWFIIHQCGKPTQTTNYLQDLELKKKSLTTDQQKNYFVQEWIGEQDLAWIFKHMKLTISRAGANTVQEISLAGKPAIFIPLLYAHHDEQWKNAEAVVKTGAALLLHQKDATPEALFQAIQTSLRQYTELSAQAKQNQELYPKDGAQRLYELVSQVAQNQKT